MNLLQRIANGFHEVNLYIQQLQQEEQTRLLAEQHDQHHEQFTDQAQMNHDAANHLHDQMNHQAMHDHSTDIHNMGGGMGF